MAPPSSTTQGAPAAAAAASAAGRKRKTAEPSDAAPAAAAGRKAAPADAAAKKAGAAPKASAPAAAAAAGQKTPAKRPRVQKELTQSSKILRNAHAKALGRSELTTAGLAEKPRVGRTAVAAGAEFTSTLVHKLANEAARWAAHANRSQMQPSDVVYAAQALGITLPSDNEAKEALVRVPISVLSITKTAHVEISHHCSNKQPQINEGARDLLRATGAFFAINLFKAAARYTIHAKRPTMLAEDIEAARKEASNDKVLPHTLPRGFDAEVKKRRAAKKGAAAAAPADD